MGSRKTRELSQLAGIINNVAIFDLFDELCRVIGKHLFSRSACRAIDC